MMIQERLDALMLIFIEQTFVKQIDPEIVIDKCKHLIPDKRRM